MSHFLYFVCHLLLIKYFNLVLDSFLVNKSILINILICLLFNVLNIFFFLWDFEIEIYCLAIFRRWFCILYCLCVKAHIFMSLIKLSRGYNFFLFYFIYFIRLKLFDLLNKRSGNSFFDKFLRKFSIANFAAHTLQLVK